MQSQQQIVINLKGKALDIFFANGVPLERIVKVIERASLDVLVDQEVVQALDARRRAGESYSDVIVRLVAERSGRDERERRESLPGGL